MGSKGAVLSVSGSRNCFLKIPQSWTSNIDKNKLQVYQVQTVEGSGLMFTTWQGDISSAASQSTDIVEINGLYAAKQGFTNGAEVLVNRIANVQTCERLFVEPLSVDDWEILELHAEYLEQHLLDQVRVAWKGQVMPLWVNNKICIFVRVESAEPASDCCLLEQMTELHIAPKDRHRTATPAVKSSAGNPSVKTEMGHQPKSVSHMKREKQSGSVPHPEVAHRNPTLPEQGPQINEDVFHRLIGYFHNLLFGAKPPDGHGEDLISNDLLDEYSYKREIFPLDRRLTASFRTQPCLDPDVTSNISTGPGGSGPEPRVEIPPVQIIDQPTCIYIKYNSLMDAIHKLDPTINLAIMPGTFLATLRPSKTPAERDEAIKKKMLNKKPLGTERAKTSQTDGLPDESEVEPQHVVRLVLLDINHSYTLYGGSGAAIASVRFGESKGPLAGHVVVGDLLRRQLSLPVTGRVCIQALGQADNTSVPPADLTGITLHPLFNVPTGFTEEMMVMAFKSWIRQVTCLDCPLVVSNGTLVKLFLQQDLYGEFLLTLDCLVPPVLPGVPMYCLLQSGLCEDLTIKVGARMTAANKPSNIQLPCWKLSEIDPKLPAVSLQQLGGIKDLFNELKSYLQVSLAVRPLDAHLMGQHRGLRGGAVLLTGPKGSGKSSLARAVCQSLAELPPLAHVTVIDCKPLRGKRVDAIQKLLNKAFSEAAWRQPAVILLDDLDHIMAAPTGPEQEMSGEAVYFTRVAAVLKDLRQREVMENSAVVVMATSRSQSSLHSSLTSSRGHHFCQKVVQLKPTDKVQRKAMLEALLAFKKGVKDECIQGLDLVKIAAQTEGHVVRDLEQIVDRALHALKMNNINQESRRKDLMDVDFDMALKGFTPMGLRHVTLHDSGDVTWKNVGGLHEVRRALVETLQWPSKYPQLFASCPLRLRSGLLLYGAPGTGKTLLAAAVAKECGLNFISIKGPELLSKYIGASEQAVRDTFERAQSAKPCILFFDEFDSLAPRRGHDNTGVTDRVVNQLLTQLDGVEGLEGVYVLAATSRPDLIDPALLRPGRLDKALHCTLPTEAERAEILEALSRQMSLSDEVNLHKVAACCNHFTGADLKALLYNAQLAGIHETTDLWGSMIRKSDHSGDKLEKPKSSPPQKDAKSGELLRNPSFEYLLPENGEVKRERNNSSLSEGSSGSDLSAGQSASWEVVTDMPERPTRVERPVTDKATAVSSTSQKIVTEEIDARGRLVAYLPRLEEGVVSVTRQKEEELLSQYQYTSDKMEKKTKGVQVITAISQRHLIDAARAMQPSVSESERRKFSQIYDNFVASKGGGFGGSIKEAGQRATLA